MSEQEPRNAQAGQRQREHLKKDRQAAGNEFSKYNLTKKNEEFVFQLNKQLERQNVASDRRPEIMQTTIEQLQAGQKKDQTAKSLFGTPTQYVKDLKNPKKQSNAKHMTKQTIKLLSVDNMIIFMSIFTFLYGLMYGLAPEAMKVQHNGSSGLTSIVIVAITGGAIFGYVAWQLQPKKKNGKWVQTNPLWFRILTIAFGLVVWLAIYMGASLLPNALNPRLNVWAYLIIGIVFFIGDIVFRRRYHIQGSLFGNRRK